MQHELHLKIQIVPRIEHTQSLGSVSSPLCVCVYVCACVHACACVRACVKIGKGM